MSARHSNSIGTALPPEWEELRITDCGQPPAPAIKAGPFGSSLTKSTYSLSGFKVYGQEQVIREDATYGDYYIDGVKFRQLSSCAVRPGDVLVSLVGTAGKVLVLPETAEPGIINPRLIRIRTNRSLVRPKFLAYFLASGRAQSQLSMLSQGGTMGVLNAGSVGSLNIPVPPAREQDAIVGVLDDVNSQIWTLEQTIDKKQAIKQGMIQQLLTGKTRLAGCSKPWREVRLGDVLSVRHGRSQRSIESASGKYPILATGGEIGRTNTPIYSKPSVLIGRKGTIDRPQFRDEPFWTVDTLFYTEIEADADPKYLYYLFTTIDWRSMNEASGVPSLSSTRVEGVRVSLPALEEQQVIQRVLSDAGSDVAALRDRLTKARAVKQGMMQELLTGRTRLPVKEPAA